MPEDNDNDNNNQGQDEQPPPDPPTGPISGALPTALDIAGMVGGCKCCGVQSPPPPEGQEEDPWPEACCQDKKYPGPSKAGSERSPGIEDKVGICKLIEAQIGQMLGPHIGFALTFEVILDVPPGVPVPEIPPPPPFFGIGVPEIDVPAMPLPVLDLSMPGMEMPTGFFEIPPPIPTPDMPPFPGMPFLGMTLFPINFGLGLIKLDPQIPIPSADPCSLINPIGMPCNVDLPGMPQMNIAICAMCILLLLLMIIMVLLVILAGLGIAKILVLDDEGNVIEDPEPGQGTPTMLDKDDNVVEIPPPLIIGNPESHREPIIKLDDDGNEISRDVPKINQFSSGARVTIIAKKFDLKRAFSNADHFAVGPDEPAESYLDLSEDLKRAGMVEGDETEEGVDGPEQEHMRYDWKVYAPEPVDETDVVKFISSLGFTTEDEKDENGEVLEGGAPAGTYKPKTLDQRTPVFEVSKTTTEHGKLARSITFGVDTNGANLPIGDYEVICFATRMAGSEPDLATKRLQSIIRIGEEDTDGVWRTVKKPTQLPEVLRNMTMPRELLEAEHPPIRTPFPLPPGPPARKIPAERPLPPEPPPPPAPTPTPTPPSRRSIGGIEV